MYDECKDLLSKDVKQKYLPPNKTYKEMRFVPVARL